MPSPQRRIAHLDMDAFFASVELLHYPQFKGLPVVIGGSRCSQALVPDGPSQHIPVAKFPRLRHYTGRGVITTATIRRAAGLALKRAPLDRPLCLLGVRVDGLSKVVLGAVVGTEASDRSQPNLF